jgi:hypothetical protein
MDVPRILKNLKYMYMDQHNMRCIVNCLKRPRLETKWTLEKIIHDFAHFLLTKMLKKFQSDIFFNRKIKMAGA